MACASSLLWLWCHTILLVSNYADRQDVLVPQLVPPIQIAVLGCPIPQNCLSFYCLTPLKLENTQARSSAGEHFPDAEGVGGSIPPVPTSVLHAVPLYPPITVSS